MNISVILATATSIITSTPDRLWVEGKTDHAASPRGVLVPLSQPASATSVTWRAWGTTFNELGFDALRLASDADRSEILRRAFAPDGELGFTRGRLTMNANDFSRAWYSCSEVEGDFDNRNFNIEHDKTNSLVYVKWALELCPGMRFFVSPWSPPAWMKINRDYCVLSSKYNRQPREKDSLLYSGSNDAVDPNEMWLKGVRGKPFPRRLATQNYFIQEPKYLQCYADQFVRFIDLYAREGVVIDRVMYQNEAYSYTPYPGCPWTAEGTVRFNRDYLAPALKRSHPEVSLWLGTFNTNRRSYMEQIMGAPGMDAVFDGIGFQWEGLDCAEYLCAKFHKPFICSEAECGNGRMDWSGARHTFWLICKNMRYGAVEWYNWNYVLCDNGRSPWGWAQNALVQVDSKTRAVRYTPEYYAVRHYSQFIRPGAVRIGTFFNVMACDGVIWRNIDGSIIIVAGNYGGDAQTLSFDLSLLAQHANSSSPFLNLALPSNSFTTAIILPCP